MQAATSLHFDFGHHLSATLSYLKALYKFMDRIDRGVLKIQICVSLRQIFSRLLQPRMSFQYSYVLPMYVSEFFLPFFLLICSCGFIQRRYCRLECTVDSFSNPSRSGSIVGDVSGYVCISMIKYFHNSCLPKHIVVIYTGTN
jgi:hypothetical protein